MAYKFRLKKKVNVGRVVTKIVATVIALYVGGTIMTEVGTVMQCTYSPFYKGLSLIGWTITDAVAVVNSTVPTTCNTGNGLTAGVTYNSVITSTTGSGILAVIGIVAIASIVTEFVEFNMG